MKKAIGTLETPDPQTLKIKEKGESRVIRLKSKNTGESIAVNLNWKTRADLDLGCFYELHPPEKRGGFFAPLLSKGVPEKSVIDGVQFGRGRGGARNRRTAQGCFTDRPFVWHTGDDRSGRQSTGESILINPEGCTQLRRMTIYAFIYDGVARWQETDAVVTVETPNNPDIVVEMGKQRSSKLFAAIAGLEFLEDRSIRVTKLVTFHDDHGDCDRAYGWGMRWRSGGK